MKVGILSAVPTSGKTTLMELLAAVFTISQGRTAALFSTGGIDDFQNSVEIAESIAKPKPDIVKAMIESAPGEKLLLDYGARVGVENVFLYNILGIQMDANDKVDFLKRAINAIPVDLTLVELTGDLTSGVNQEIIQVLDCSFMLIHPCHKAINGWQEIRKLLPKCPGTINCAPVASIIDPKCISMKNMASRLGLKIENLYSFPENDLLQKMALVGALDQCAEKIVNGDAQYVSLRQPLLQMMQFIFDYNDVKIIRPIADWYH